MCVTLGVTSFLLTGPVTSKTSTGNSTTGFLLLLAFLGLDGFTSTMQEKLFREHTTSKYNQMLYVNMFSSIGALVYAATMNVRQVVSIMVSYATYNNTITLYQVASLLVVFGALFYKCFAGLAGYKSD